MSTEPAQLRRLKEMLKLSIAEIREIHRLVEKAEAELSPPDDLIRRGELSTRVTRCLMRAGITTWGALEEQTYVDLLCMNNFGRVSLREVEHALAARGRALRGRKLER